MEWNIYELKKPEHIQSRDCGDRVILEYSYLNNLDSFETMGDAIKKIEDDGDEFVEYTVQLRIYKSPFQI